MHIQKLPTGNSKGIIIITHKELAYLSVDMTFRKRNIPKFLLYPLFWILRNYFSINLQRIRSKYFIGVHWGAFNKLEKSPAWVDFHMSAPGTAILTDGKPVIPMNSANFTSQEMRKKSYPKIWDIISISKSNKVKNIDLLMKSVRQIFDSGRRLRVLLIISSNKFEPANVHYTRVLEDYNNLFSEDEREDFVLLKTHPDTGFKGLSTKFVSDLLNMSKVFTLFSQVEGESRVIKEAQLCGLPVVVKSDLLGGGRDYLNSGNSLFFDEYIDAWKTLLSAVDCFESFTIDSEDLEVKISEKHTIAEFERELRGVFDYFEQPFHGSLINLDCLSRRLPSHYSGTEIFWQSRKKNHFSTTDIINIKSFLIFLRHLSRYEKGQ